MKKKWKGTNDAVGVIGVKNINMSSCVLTPRNHHLSELKLDILWDIYLTCELS